MKIDLTYYPDLDIESIYSVFIEILAKDIPYNLIKSELDPQKKLIFDIIKQLKDEHSLFKNKYYNHDGKGILNPLYIDHYAKLIYLISNRIYESSSSRFIPDCLFNSMKSRCGLDLYYEVIMPKYFYPMHSYSTVLGRASYGEFFCIRQNCTVGNNNKTYPSFGDGVIMRANSTVIGNCHIGNNVHIGAGVLIVDTDIPDNSVVIGRSPNLIIKENTNSNIEYYFNI